VSKLKVGIVALLALLLVAIPSAASAAGKFTSSKSASQSVTTDVLQPPTNLKFTCLNSGGRITVTWTVADTYTTGYTITGTYQGQSQSVTFVGTAASYSPAQTDVPQNTTITLKANYIKAFGSGTTAWTSAVSAPLLINKDCP
jgi:hypothetical protein